MDADVDAAVDEELKSVDCSTAKYATAVSKDVGIGVGIEVESEGMLTPSQYGRSDAVGYMDRERARAGAANESQPGAANESQRPGSAMGGQREQISEGSQQQGTRDHTPAHVSLPVPQAILDTSTTRISPVYQGHTGHEQGRDPGTGQPSDFEVSALQCNAVPRTTTKA